MHKLQVKLSLSAPILIKKAKYADLMSLMKFCSPRAQKFYRRLAHESNCKVAV